MKNLEKSLPKWLKPIKFKRADPNEIIEVQDDYRRMILNLPPERITRREYNKRWDREIKKSTAELRKFLKDKQKWEEWDRKHPSKIRFGYALAYN